MRLLALVFALFVPLGEVSADPALVTAIEAAEAQDYDVAYGVAEDDLTVDLVTWLRLRDLAQPFEDYLVFLNTRPDWPGMSRLRARAEVSMVKGTDPAKVLAFFEGATPETGQGALRLAEALMTTGNPEKAKEVLAAAWVDLRLSDSDQEAMIASFGDVLAPLHDARVDALLWRWRTDEAARMLPLLSEDMQALVNARIIYIRNRGGKTDALAAVPDALKSSPGLAYDRFNWLSDQGNRTEAIALALERSVSVEALGEPFRWSGWRRSLARWEMREGRIDQAYALASQHFLTEGSSFADLEWLAGYIALTYLDDAALAMDHFRAMEAAVDSPISVGRAGYWIGRAAEDLGDANAAAAAFEIAAQHQTGFYGLLAAERLGLPLDPALTGAQDAVDWQGAAVMQADMTRAALGLMEAGERGLATLFFAQLGRTLDAEGIGQLGAYLQEKDEAYFAVLIGKAAVTQGVVVPSVYFPLHPLMDMDLPVPVELSLAIARRESEFNAGVGSPVGALGLMQLMPATAQEVSGQLGLPYAKSRLTGDWTYNATLGSQYLAGLTETFGYSPVQIAAGYNAGPSRPKTWMDQRGDPRLGVVDVVDWIEHIPFRETRNYVMRVTESLPVYRARLTGETGPIAFTALLVGAKPLVRPVARGLRSPATANVSTSSTPVASNGAIASPSAVPAPPGIRPISRPGG